MPIWITPKSVYDKCGEEAGNVASKTIDGCLTSSWGHNYNHTHWIKYDLGADMEVSGIRVYADGDVMWEPCEISAIYVSNDPNNWGSSVGSLTLGTSLQWHQTTFTAKTGRYIYLNTIKTYMGVLEGCVTGAWLTKFYEFQAYCAVTPKSRGYIFG